MQTTAMELVATGSGLAKVDGEALQLLDLPYPTVSDLLRDRGSLAAARGASVLESVPISRIGAALGGYRNPFTAPFNIWGVGLNYRSKADHVGRDLPTEPILYIKPPDAAAGPFQVIPTPTPRPDQLDYEAELVIVIGRSLYRASPDEAADAIAAITAGNDGTARDVMARTKNPMLAKGFKGLSPVGPSVRSVVDPEIDLRVRVRSWVNGELRQDGRSDDFIFEPADLLSRLSHLCELGAGDVLFTGTPPGTGQDLGIFLSEGDEVVVQIDDMLPLVNWLGQAPADRDHPAETPPESADTVDLVL